MSESRNCEDTPLHESTDAARWAREFKTLFPHPDLDEGWMISWFANAIEAGRAAGSRATSSETKRGIPQRAIEIAEKVVREWDNYTFDPDEDTDSATLLDLARLLTGDERAGERKS